MDSDCDVSNSDNYCIRSVEKLITTIKLEGLVWKNSESLFGLTLKIEIWMR